MNPPQCDDLDYIHFLIAAQRVFTCTEAARCQPQAEDAPAHDAFTRLLQRQPFNTEALWQEAKAFVDRKRGLLVLEDTTLDKPYAKKMDLVTYQAGIALWRHVFRAYSPALKERAHKTKPYASLYRWRRRRGIFLSAVYDIPCPHSSRSRRQKA